MKRTTVLGAVGVAALLMGIAFEGVATAAPELRVRCEVRAGRRSKVSVDGNNLPKGTYAIKVTSGANTATARKSVAGGANDEFESDFDSDPGDVRAGATAINRNFIVNRKVSVAVTGPVKLSATGVGCRAR